MNIRSIIVGFFFFPVILIGADGDMPLSRSNNQVTSSPHALPGSNSQGEAKSLGLEREKNDKQAVHPINRDSELAKAMIACRNAILALFPIPGHNSLDFYGNVRVGEFWQTGQTSEFMRNTMFVTANGIFETDDVNDGDWRKEYFVKLPGKKDFFKMAGFGALYPVPEATAKRKIEDKEAILLPLKKVEGPIPSTVQLTGHAFFLFLMNDALESLPGAGYRWRDVQEFLKDRRYGDFRKSIGWPDKLSHNTAERLAPCNNPVLHKELFKTDPLTGKDAEGYPQFYHRLVQDLKLREAAYKGTKGIEETSEAPKN